MRRKESVGFFINSLFSGKSISDKFQRQNNGMEAIFRVSKRTNNLNVQLFERDSYSLTLVEKSFFHHEFNTVT